MGIFLCAEERGNLEESHDTRSESERKRMLARGILSHSSENDPLFYVPPKSEDVVLQSRPDQLQTIINNQQKEIERLTDLYEKSVQEAALKKAELKNLESQKQSNEASSRNTYDAQCVLESEHDLKSRCNVSIPADEYHNREKSLSLRSSSSISPPSVLPEENSSDSDMMGGSPIVLKDFEFPINVKQPFGHFRSGSLPADMIKVALGNQSCFEGVESKISKQLDVIDTKLMSTNVELKKMRRHSIDILVGRGDGTESWEQIEKNINNLSAKKFDLEKERFETCMNLQSQLLVPANAEGTVSKMKSEHHRNGLVLESNENQCTEDIKTKVKKEA